MESHSIVDFKYVQDLINLGFEYSSNHITIGTLLDCIPESIEIGEDEIATLIIRKGYVFNPRDNDFSIVWYVEYRDESSYSCKVKSDDEKLSNALAKMVITLCRLRKNK